MISAEMRREIRREVRNYLNVIGHGIARGGANVESQSLEQNYPGGPKMAERPVAHPYGFVSRAPDGMLAVTGRVGEHPGAQMTIAHRDPARTNFALEYGEAGIYNLNLGGVFARSDKIALGSLVADNPTVLGTELLEFLTNIIDALIAGDLFLSTSPGNPTAPNPAKTATFTEWKTKYLATSSSNIVSQYVFTTRSAP